MVNETNDVILTILKYLEESLDDERIDASRIDADTLGISNARYSRILTMMLDDGLIAGLHPVNVAGVTYTQYKFMDPCITTKGIEYIERNKPSAKVYTMLKELRDWVK